MTAYTPELAIPEVAQTQNNKYITMNDALVFLGAASNKTLPSATTGNWALTEAQFTRYLAFKASGRAGAFDITLPDAINVTNPERFFIVWNADTTYTATIKAATTPGATVTLKPGYVALCYRNGVDTYAFIVGGAGTTGPYDLGFFLSGLPGDNIICMEWKAIRAFTIPGNCAGSAGKVGTNPTATAVFAILKNGGSVGTISISTGGVFTFATTAGAAQSFAVGDVLSVTTPTPQDATLADVGVAFLGTRTGI